MDAKFINCSLVFAHRIEATTLHAADGLSFPGRIKMRAYLADAYPSA
jgi:hypothetical protein